ncbi:FAD-dependent monooxygenase [Rhodococcus rhodochrous]|uniref:FAD-dependent monooxygenase n=1 Tax=Rhodococcus rhodochrous TaxID=1829 RepID=UPI0032DFEF25
MIVGRGPVGMTTALLLARWGVPSIIVDPMPANQTLPGSKAVLIAGHVMAMTEPLGVGQTIADEGLAWTTSRTFIRGREVLSTDVSSAAGLLPKVVNLTQKRVEELLLERVHAEPLITLLSESKVVDFEETDDGVTARIETPSGESTLTTAWLVGCDGSRSTVRKKLGIAFEGYGHDENFLIVDIRAELPFPNERHFHFDPEFNPGRTVLIHPQPDSTWHIDWQVGPEIDAEQEQSSGRLERRIRSVIGDVDYELHWLTTYQFKQLKAHTFRKGRCFLVGDAAHLTSPYGARGMNSGIADAENLAWRLAMVIRNEASEKLLDGYAVEREYTSAENLAITGATARFMCPSTFREKAIRRATLEAARIVPAARRLINSGQFYDAVTYPPTMLGATTTPVSGIPVGTLAPDALIATTDPAIGRLGQLLRRGIVLLTFPGHDPAHLATVIEDTLAALTPELPVTAVEVVRGVPATTGNTRHIQVHDADGSLQRQWCPESLPAAGYAYILRPDGYVAAQPTPDAARIVAALNSVFELRALQKGKI